VPVGAEERGEDAMVEAEAEEPQPRFAASLACVRNKEVGNAATPWFFLKD
jgi:hypothetical protein